MIAGQADMIMAVAEIDSVVIGAVSVTVIDPSSPVSVSYRQRWWRGCRR
jgi:hypothetical protein